MTQSFVLSCCWRQFTPRPQRWCWCDKQIFCVYSLWCHHLSCSLGHTHHFGSVAILSLPLIDTSRRDEWTRRVMFNGIQQMVTVHTVSNNRVQRVSVHGRCCIDLHHMIDVLPMKYENDASLLKCWALIARQALHISKGTRIQQWQLMWCGYATRRTDGVDRIAFTRPPSLKADSEQMAVRRKMPVGQHASFGSIPHSSARSQPVVLFIGACKHCHAQPASAGSGLIHSL